MAEAISVARPYAVAAFDAANKLGDLKNWSQLLQAAAEAVLNPDIQMLVNNPRVPRTQLEGLMLALCGEQISTEQGNFIKLLAESQRLAVLPEITALFEAMRAEAEKSADITVTSAFELDEPQKQKVAAAMTKRMGREVRLHCETDSELLGGIIIRVGDKVIDGSARTRLAELTTALA